MKKLSKFPACLLNNNRLLLIASLVVSFVIWYVFTLFYNPISTTSVKDVPIQFDISNTAVSALGLDIVSSDVETVTVRISGKTVEISNVSASDLVVTPSLSSVTEAGTYEVSLNVSSSRLLSDYDIVSVSPSKAKMTFDQVVTRTFDVVAEAPGCTATDDLIAEVPVLTESSTKVLNVSGGKQDVDRIASVVARTDAVEQLSESTSFDAPILLLDENGKEIDSSHMTLGFRSANITVNISAIRTLSVKPTFVDVPNGVDLDYTLSTKEVTVIGKPSAIADMEYVTLENISVGQITTENNVFERNFALPSGVRIYDDTQNNPVTVTVKTGNYTSKTLKVGKVTFVGLDDGLKATLQNVQSITVMGLRSKVNALTSDDLVVTVDTSGLGVSTGNQRTASVGLSDQTSGCWVVTYSKNYLVTFSLEKS